MSEPPPPKTFNRFIIDHLSESFLMNRKKFCLKVWGGVPVVAHWKRIWLRTMRLGVQSLASLSELRLRRCSGVWHRSQMQLGCWVAVDVSRQATVTLIWPLAWEHPYSVGVALKSKKWKKKKKKRFGEFPLKCYGIRGVSVVPGGRFDPWTGTVG